MGTGKGVGEGRGANRVEHLRTPDEYLSHSPVKRTLMEREALAGSQAGT